MVVAAGIDVLELAGFVVTALSIEPFEEEALDFVGRVERVAFLRIAVVGKTLERSANVSGERLTFTIGNVAEHEHFAGPEDVGRTPVERAPVQRQTQIAFALRRKAANRRTVEGEVIEGAQ